jgi:demethylmenaquinone methyltransferase/2-methoxy-6-polyprenyl-1,4-benzoquinol methylase
MNNKDYFNSVAERWDSLVSHPQERMEYVLDSIPIKGGSRVLDVGSGTGVLLPLIARRIGPRGTLTALDISERMIEFSRRKNSVLEVEFVTCDFLRFENSARFDLVIAYSCYPHFLDRVAFYSKANTLLYEGGKLVIAHIEGRESINALHDGPDGPPSIPLPPVAVTMEEARSAGFRPVFTRDDEEYYIAIVEKFQ